AQFLERERPYFEESVLEVEETVDNYCRVEAHPRDDSIHDWYRDRLHDDEPMLRLQVQYR
ncbi:MAG: hypothetical protein SVU32_05070, partial [Candidatus Nanohaloarchaea archaeon]|nr:hypothetical protein [Candidatus Nanohaloarchaea archaeon]